MDYFKEDTLKFAILRFIRSLKKKLIYAVF